MLPLRGTGTSGTVDAYPEHVDLQTYIKFDDGIGIKNINLGYSNTSILNAGNTNVKFYIWI